MSAASFLKRIAAQKRRLGIGAAVLIGLVGLYGLLGYFWLPGYIRAKVESELPTLLHRPVTVRSIEIQPYTLEFTVHGFRIGEKSSDADAGKDLLSFEELYVNVSGASLTKGAAVISAVTLRQPAVRLVREGENRFNITDLIEDFMKQPPSEGGKTTFSVSNIRIEDGSFTLVDQVKDSRQEISGIRLGVPFVANLESDEQSWVEPHFSANVNGAPLTLSGKLRPFSANREATLELKLNDVDLTHVDEYSPVPVGIRLRSGYLDSNLMLTFTQTDGEPPKIVLTGEAALRKLGIENRSTEIPYAADIAEIQIKPVEFNLNGARRSHVALTLTGGAIAREGESQPLLSLPLLRVSQSSIDLAHKSVTLGDIMLEQINASLRREGDGRLNLAKLFAPVHRVEASPEAPPPVKAKSGEPWEVKLGSLKLAGASLRYEDVSLTDVAPMVVEPLDLTVSDVDLSGARPLKLALKAGVNQHGKLETSGTLAWAPMGAELDVDAKDLDLVSLQGWAGDRINALITSGAISFNGKIRAEGSPIKVAVNGDSQFSNFRVLDKAATTDLMRWRTLDINGIDFVNEPLRVNVNSVAIADFFAFVVITPKGELNLKNMVKQEGSRASPAAPPLPSESPEQGPATSEKVAKVEVPPKGKSIPVRIARISLRGGNVNFHDEFIKPNYRANLTGLAGRVGPLDPGKTGEIDINGAVDKTAPLKISGKVNPFSKELYLDVTAMAKGIDMPPFSPYSGKYIGYTIEKGKLSVDVHYRVEKGELTAENNVFLDQLTFGEKVESPDALSVPVKLAVALLKDRHGEINVHLPVSGSINDPKFSIGSLLINAFMNLISKAATAPFTLLGSLFAGGEELSEVDFQPGHADLSQDAEKRLQALAKALVDRPALKLEITGEADSTHDPEALKRLVLERKVKARKLVENVKKGATDVSLDNIELNPDEYAKYLTAVYKDEKFEKPKNIIGFAKSLPVPEMEQLLLANISAGEGEMRDLAEARAENARDWLIEKGGIPNERIFLLQPKIEAGEGGKRSSSKAQFSLS